MNDRQDQNLNDLDLNNSNLQNTQAGRNVIAAQNSQVTINRSFISLFGNRQEPVGIDWDWANRVIDLQLTQIQIRLRDTLLQNQLLTIDLQAQPQAVGRSPLESNWQLQSRGNNIETIDPDRLAIEVFGRKDIRGKLLILGRPGAGKTTVLLKLAEQLIDGAKQHPKTVIPVIFELSAWNKDEQSIRDFTIEQLYENVGGDRKKKIYEQWLERGVLLPLFDGLDELGLERQQKCTVKLNEFATHYPQIVVCCRVKEFETVGLELNRLNSAIVLQPLSDEQIQDYLHSVDRSGLWAQIQTNPEMKQMLAPDAEGEPGLLRVPLFISISAAVYESGQPFGSKGELLERYIDRQLSIYVRKSDRRRQELARRKWAFKSPECEPDWREVRHSLGWMARKLQERNQVELLIEKIQPSWLETDVVIRRYRLAGGLIFGLVFGPMFGLTDRTTYGLIHGLIFGLTGGLIFGLFFADSEITLVESFKLSTTKESRFIVIYRMKLWLIIGLIIGLMGGGLESLMFGLVGGMIFGLRQGLKQDLQIRSYPNQGIWNSLQSIVLIAILSYPLVIILSVVLNKITSSISQSVLAGKSLGFILSIIQTSVLQSILPGIPVAIFFGSLLGGGFACIKHFSLRLVLTQDKKIPWNFARFLNYCAERRLLQRIGGRYRFIHRELLDHFAAQSGGGVGS